MSRLEALVEQGVGVAWASALPVAGLQAFALRGRRDLIARYRKAVLELEARAQLAWLEPDPTRELVAAGVADEGAKVGYIAALRGKEHVDRLIAELDADGRDPDAVVLGAVLAVPALVDAYAERLPREDPDTEGALQSLEMPLPTVWLPPLAAAMRANDRDGALDRVINSMLAAASLVAREYVSAILDASPSDRAEARLSIERLVEQLPVRGDHRAIRRFVGRMSVRFRKVVEAGERAAIDAVLPRIIEVLGPPETWGPRAFGALCALDRSDGANAACPEPNLRDRVLLLESYARVGDQLRFDRELHQIVENGSVCTSVFRLDVITQLLEPPDVVRVARVTREAGRDDRLHAALARFT